MKRSICLCYRGNVSRRRTCARTLNGRIDTGMPAFPGLTEADVIAVAHYLKTFSPRWQEPPEAKTP